MSIRTPNFAFSLGREFKLSVAEIASVCGFHTIASVSPKLAFVRLKDSDAAIAAFKKLGGSIRLFEVKSETTKQDFSAKALDYLQKTLKQGEGKNSFALASVGPDLKLSEIGLRIKKQLKSKDVSIRLCNTDDRTINAASFKKDKLSETRLECAYLEDENERGYFAVTLACQDVDEFAKRDLNKGRDMEVGMLPPKLARMMVNLVSGRGGAETSEKASTGFVPKRIYDPFCGLGTVLIEAADLGYRDLLGSDVSEKMAISSAEALEKGFEEEKYEYNTFVLDAKKIASRPESFRGAAIVTEGFLGEIQSAKTVSAASVAEQKKILYPIYEGFFQGLRQLEFKGTVVMCVPFWEVNGSYVFFEEFFEILKKYGFYSDSLLPKDFSVKATKFGSLVYKRPGQTVGREIVRIVPGRMIRSDDGGNVEKKPYQGGEKSSRPSQSNEKPAQKRETGAAAGPRNDRTGGSSWTSKPGFRGGNFDGGRNSGFGSGRSGGGFGGQKGGRGSGRGR